MSKVSALILDVPGAPGVWHSVEGVPGLVHPEVAVPYPNAKKIVDGHRQRCKDAEKEWDAHEKRMDADGWRHHGRLKFEAPPCPVKLVQVSDDKAEQGEAAHAAARTDAVSNLPGARRSGNEEDRHLAENEAAALTGGDKGGQ